MRKKIKAIMSLQHLLTLLHKLIRKAQSSQKKKDLPIIQSLWIGQRLSDLERLCIRSFLQKGHPFHLYTYNEI